MQDYFSDFVELSGTMLSCVPLLLVFMFSLTVLTSSELNRRILMIALSQSRVLRFVNKHYKHSPKFLKTNFNSLKSTRCADMLKPSYASLAFPVMQTKE